MGFDQAVRNGRRRLLFLRVFDLDTLKWLLVLMRLYTHPVSGLMHGRVPYSNKRLPCEINSINLTILAPAYLYLAAR